MAGAYSQDSRDRVINAVVVRGDANRCAAAARFGVSGSSAIRAGSSERPQKWGGYKRVRLEPHRAFLEGLWAEKS